MEKNPDEELIFGRKAKIIKTKFLYLDFKTHLVMLFLFVPFAIYYVDFLREWLLKTGGSSGWLYAVLAPSVIAVVIFLVIGFVSRLIHWNK